MSSTWMAGEIKVEQIFSLNIGLVLNLKVYDKGCEEEDLLHSSKKIAGSPGSADVLNV